MPRDLLISRSMFHLGRGSVLGIFTGVALIQKMFGFFGELFETSATAQEAKNALLAGFPAFSKTGLCAASPDSLPEVFGIGES